MINHKKFSVKQKEQALEYWRSEYNYKYGYKQAYIDKVCSKYHCSRASLKGWLSLQRQGLSLENKDPTPKTPHPNKLSDIEIEVIAQTIKDNPTFGCMELSDEVRQRLARSIHRTTVDKYVKKLGHVLVIENVDDPASHFYHTNLMLGHTLQVDVKFVPSICINKPPFAQLITETDKKYYQYSAIDTASREAFIYPYDEHTAENASDFIKRAVAYFGYIPKIVQTDNGTEFKGITLEQLERESNESGQAVDYDKEHPFEKALRELNIHHKYIRVRTPRHNGKVERFHRTCQERFYNNLHFTDLADLRQQMAVFNKHNNNTSMTCFINRSGKNRDQSPMQKRAELLELLKEQHASLDNTVVMSYVTVVDGKIKKVHNAVTLDEVNWLIA